MSEEANLFVKIPIALNVKLKEYCEKNNKTVKEVVCDALEQFLKRKSDDAGLRQIVVKYKGKCVRCGKEIDVGEIAYYGSGLLVCIECFAKQTGHLPDLKKALNAYVAYRRYKALANEAKRELDALVERINDVQIMEDMSSIVSKIEAVLQTLNDYVTYVERNDKLDEIISKLDEIKEKMDEIIAARAFKIKKYVKKELRLNG